MTDPVDAVEEWCGHGALRCPDGGCLSGGRGEDRAKRPVESAVGRQSRPVEFRKAAIRRQREVDRRAEADGSGVLTRRRESSEAGSAEHTSELQSLMRRSYAVFCLKQ